MAQTGTGAGTGQIGHRVLGIYLNDHLAGATAGTELAHRVARTDHAQGQGGQLKRLAAEIAQDRAGAQPFVAGWLAPPDTCRARRVRALRTALALPSLLK
jgi:hypothetical protein